MNTFPKPVMMNGLIQDETSADATSSAATSGAAVETQAAEPKTAEPQGLVDPTPAQQTAQNVHQEQNALMTTEEKDNLPAPVRKAGGSNIDISELGYGAFSKVKIENGEFDVDGMAAGKEIRVSVIGRKVQKLIKPAGIQDPAKEQLAYYTEDPDVADVNSIMTTRGVSVGEFKAQLREEGLKVEESEYEMAGVQILQFSSSVGDVVPVGTIAEMQIPGASIQRFRGLMFTAQEKGIPWGQRVLRVMVGPKTQGGNGKTYNPWNFKSVEATTDQFCAKFGIDLTSSAGDSLDDLDENF